MSSSKITVGAHSKGKTCVAFSRDGLRAFTGGEDSIVRIWTVSEGTEQEPIMVGDAENAVTSISTAEDCWVFGSLDSEARRYSRDSEHLDTTITKIPGGIPVRCVAIDPQGRRVAVTSDELYVKVINMEDVLNVHRLEGYTSGVRSATWDPSGTLLATCTADGKIVIWNMSPEKPVIEKTIDDIIPAVRDPDSLEFSYDCSVVWHTSGKHFYVANKGHEIVTISRDDWSKTSTFSDKKAAGAITALALSPNGVYLASASQSRVHIWSTQTKRIVVSEIGNLGTAITQLAFSPRENLVAWTDGDGSFIRWPKPISDTFPDPVKSSISTNGSATVSIKPKTGLDLFAEETNEPAGAADLDNTGDVDLDEDMADIDDAWIVDDLDGALNDPPAPERAGKDGFVKEMVSITQAQPPFQPGSTPMENRKRYLAYNMVGVIEVTDQETHNIVNVEFFDRSLRKGYHFTDNFKYDLGYLGERGAVYACPPENDHPAEVLFKPYGQWRTTDWTYTLPKGVSCLGIAAGAPPLASKDLPNIELQGYGHVVVATTQNDLTFLSGTGRERRILALPGDFVTMVASAEWVFVVHRAGSTTIDGSQNLSYTMINFEDFSVRQRDILPVPKGHTLKWIGLTDQGAPAMYDTTGCVHILTKYRIPHHASWARVLDTNLLERRQGKDESYWPVGITESNFMCLILKGRQEHPTFPRPLIQELSLRIPFRHVEPQEETFERETLMIQIALDSLDEELYTPDIISREKALDKEVIQLIQAACKGGNTARAIELTKLLHNTASIDAATKIANFYHFPGLKERMEIIKSEREDAEDRFRAAREKRRRWLKSDPPVRVLAEHVAAPTRVDPLADFRPPPAVERPGMARVTTPRIEKTKYTSLLPSTQNEIQTPEPSTWEDTLVPDSPPSTDSKRKRVDIEDSIPSSDILMPPPKQRANPFARKETNKNPFARKADVSKTIQKSESFFDKVDAAESENGAKKRPSTTTKSKKDGSKQTTLFGMLPKADKVPRPKKNATSKEGTPAESVQDTQAESQVDTQMESQLDSQMTDVTMTDLETQDAQDTQTTAADKSSDWEETQLVDPLEA